MVVPLVRKNTPIIIVCMDNFFFFLSDVCKARFILFIPYIPHICIIFFVEWRRRKKWSFFLSYGIYALGKQNNIFPLVRFIKTYIDGLMYIFLAKNTYEIWNLAETRWVHIRRKESRHEWGKSNFHLCHYYYYHHSSSSSSRRRHVPPKTSHICSERVIFRGLEHLSPRSYKLHGKFVCKARVFFLCTFSHKCVHVGNQKEQA